MFMPSCSGYGHEMAPGPCVLWRHRRLWTVAHLLRPCETLEQPLIRERKVRLAAIAQDGDFCTTLRNGALNRCRSDVSEC
jgi:hypothetical protein